MTFKMYNDLEDYAEVNEAVIRKAMAELNARKLEFLVLEAGRPVNYNAYVQTATEDNGLVLETRFIYDEENYKHYHKKGLTAGEVQKVFLDYLNGINPDVNTPGWEEMDI